MTKISFDKIYKIYFPLAFFAGIINNIDLSLVATKAHWGLSEWLINYSGGFVRRGLPGEIILKSGFDPRLLSIIISFTALSFLLYYLYKKTKGIFDFYVILSPIFMGVVYYGFGYGILRKDIFLVVVFSLLLINISQKKSSFTGAFLISLGMLTHEMFFFMSVPAITLYLFLTKESLNKYFYFSIYPIVLMLVLVIYKGDESIAITINSSLNNYFISYCPNSCSPSGPQAAISAIGWSTSKGLSLSKQLLSTPLILMYWFLIVIFSSLISIAYFKDKENVDKWILILIFQFISISPLFILGWDFGRWINIWMLTSLIIFINFKYSI
ncbi:hypothetical protein AB4451_24900, partial [Vibrio lentus]